MRLNLLGHLSAGGRRGVTETSHPPAVQDRKTAPPPLRRGVIPKDHGGLHDGWKTRCDAWHPPSGEPQEKTNGFETPDGNVVARFLDDA